MISASDRNEAVTLIKMAVGVGARTYKACEELGVTMRTYQRWTAEGSVKVDGRPSAKRPVPKNKLTQNERCEILAIANSVDYGSLPPSQIVPALADDGLYIASESSFYRVLRENNQQHHRGRSQAANRGAATSHTATAPNQVWCWDITWLAGPAKGVFYYLYLILDLYSRKVVGWEVHDQESSEDASILVRKAHLRENVGIAPLVLHSDNGSPMKGASLLVTLHELCVANSYSRPRVSNDNAYAESIFRTCKYRPEYPSKGFSTLQEARTWVLKFVHWYNYQHKHSGLKFVTPAQRHSGEAEEITANRQQVYQEAKAKNPARWSGNTRNWELPKVVCLNPERESAELKKAS